MPAVRKSLCEYRLQRAKSRAARDRPRPAGDKSCEEVLLTGARSLATRFKPEVGLIRSWDHNRDKWQYPVIIDNMMNLELLMWAADRSGDKSLRDMAVSHADKTLKHHFRPDFSSCHLVSYDTISGQPHLKQTHQGLSDSSAWSRGQAWGLYGYTCMYRLTGNARYLEQARGIAGFLINHRNMPADGIPYWDFDAPALASTPRGGEQAHDRVAQLVEGQAHGVTRRGAALVGAGQRIDEEGRIGDDQVEAFVRREFLHGTLFERHPAAPRRRGGVFAGLRDLLHIDARNKRFGSALGHHQGDQPGACTDVEDAAVRRPHAGPCAEQHAVGSDLHRAAVLTYGESFEAEHRQHSFR